MSDFTTPVDIANRALQHLGAKRITTLADATKNAAAINNCYDKLRMSELRRNVWKFSTRRAPLRPLDVTSMNLVPGAFDNTKQYLLGSIVSSGGLVYEAQALIAPGGGTPDVNIGPTGWLLYFGPMVAQPYDTTGKTGYYTGELVYSLSGTTVTVYRSMVSNNSVDPTAGPPAWSATTIYNKGQTVTQSATVYQSTIDLNLNNTPPSAQWQTLPGTQPDEEIGSSWLKLGAATVTSIQLIYPLGSGPSSQTATRNVFVLPNGFLKKAPQDPKQGGVSYLGSPSGLGYDDWNEEGNYIVTREVFPIILRFAADVAYVPFFDTMFCEGLAARIAMEVCEELTQSAEKINVALGAYNKFMGEARIANGIETGADEPPIDDWISTRI